MSFLKQSTLNMYIKSQAGLDVTGIIAWTARYPKCSSCKNIQGALVLHSLHTCKAAILHGQVYRWTDSISIEEFASKAIQHDTIFPPCGGCSELWACSSGSFPARSPKPLFKLLSPVLVIVTFFIRVWGHHRKGLSSSYVQPLLQKLEVLDNVGIQKL